MPPDPQGRESYVYIMNGAAIRSVKDLTIDDLSPWNCEFEFGRENNTWKTMHLTFKLKSANLPHGSVQSNSTAKGIH
jgi:hypothetical protein